MAAREVDAGGFRLLTYRRLAAGASLSVYVEGDGRAWRWRQPPADPTPGDPLSLRLATLDPSPSVLWIGRPCTYLAPGAAAACGERWWTSHRYAAEVVSALDAVVSDARAEAGASTVRLIGYSGGGVLATLLAARRDDVEALVTVASPLALSRWTSYHGVTPLTGSIDPVSVAPRLAGVTQHHVAGDRDRVVPPEIVRAFVEALPRPVRARFEVVADQDHACCWAETWPDLLRH